MITNKNLLNESNYSCAYCGEKLVKNLTEHHIDGNKRNNVYDNKIILCHNCHHRVTNKKGITNQEIREKKKFLILKTLTQYGVNVLKICSRNELGVTAMPFLLHHLVDMGYLEKKETVMEYGDREGDHIEETARYIITSEGRKLYEKWLKG